VNRRAFLASLGAAASGLLLACTPQSAPTAAPKATAVAGAKAPSTQPKDLWDGAGIDRRLLLQHEVDKLPDGPHMLRVTELEMEPGASIDPHSHLGPGAQVVLSGSFTMLDAQSGATAVLEPSQSVPFPTLYSGQTTRYSTENRGGAWNRLFMVELMSQSREFLGNQQFDTEGGVHNRGGVRSGPYLQLKLQRLPESPLMLRVTQIDMGPKARSPEYIRPGPGVFAIISGQVTFRRQSDLFITTQGAGGYYADEGEPIILENKPITPNRLIAVELLPASLGKQPSTFPTGVEIKPTSDR
jgi:hypothetical protein